MCGWDTGREVSSVTDEQTIRGLGFAIACVYGLVFCLVYDLDTWWLY